jgi:hypothetical protein
MACVSSGLLSTMPFVTSKFLSNCGPLVTVSKRGNSGYFGRKSIAKIVSDTVLMKIHTYMSALKLPLLADIQHISYSHTFLLLALF